MKLQRDLLQHPGAAVIPGMDVRCHRLHLLKISHMSGTGMGTGGQRETLCQEQDKKHPGLIKSPETKGEYGGRMFDAKTRN